jgi:hypothetical protein
LSTFRVDDVPGASDQTRRVKTLSANWMAGPEGADGRFELLLITEDDERHVVAPSPASTVAVVALSQADTVLLWDPEDRTLIAANVIGQMPWTDDRERTGQEPATPRRTK